MAARDLVLLLIIAATSASEADQIQYKLGESSQNVQSHGLLHEVGSVVKIAALAAREPGPFDPDNENVYYLFTKENPSGEVLHMGNSDLLGSSNFNSGRRTAIVIHGYLNDAVGYVNSLLVPAFLEAEDMNVIAVDWTVGSTPWLGISLVDYYSSFAALNTVTSGKAVARFINWLNKETGATPSQYHLVGHSLGAHQVGVAGRNVEGNIAYISESLVSGGFSGTRCATYDDAVSGNCSKPESLNMGGITPKTGHRGIFYLETNAWEPYSKS